MQFLELKVPPLVLLLLAILLMWLTAALFPVAAIKVGYCYVLAGTFAAIGALIAVTGVIAFRRVHTTVDPTAPEKTSSLVVVGVYQVSRNPMYLGFLLVLVGAACFFENILSFFVVPLYFLYINRFQIQPEERAMVDMFGPEYEAYKASVRRWI